MHALITKRNRSCDKMRLNLKTKRLFNDLVRTRTNLICHSQARREGGSFPGPRDVWGALPSLKNTESGAPYGFFLT